MDNPVFVNLLKDQWVKVATGVFGGTIHLINPNGLYLQAYRLTGDPEPTIMREGVKAFELSQTEIIPPSEGLDVYLWADNNCTVRVDVGNGAGINKYGSTIVLDTFNNRVFNHQVFMISKRLELAGNDSIILIFDPTEKGAYLLDTLIQLPFSIKAYNGGPIDIDIYTGVDSANDGDIIESIDKNYIDQISAHCTVRKDPTINNLGVKSPIENIIFSEAGTNKIAGNLDSADENLLTILDPTVRYAVELTNKSSDSADVLVKLKWFEV